MKKLIKGFYKHGFSITLVIICNLSLLVVSGQNITTEPKQPKSDTHEKSISLFGPEEMLNVSLYLDLQAFSKKPSKSNSFDADMTIHMSESDSLNKKVTIKYRGISRFQICSFPPIEINFQTPLYVDSGKIKKMKLVTHCQPGGATDEYVLREYLVYKMFNVLTDTSFRVRLLKINYIDSKKNKKTIIKYGIFLEPIDLLAKRTKTTIVKSRTATQKDIIPVVIDRVAIFNYMVSNWDWSVAGLHNIVIIKQMNNVSSPLGIAVPYDFDYTGIVNADYAIPPENMGIENIRHRLFSGICRSKEIYKEDLNIFLINKDKLYSVITGCAYLNQRSKKDITGFMDQFFDKLDNQKSIDNLIEVFLNMCKK